MYSQVINLWDQENDQEKETCSPIPSFSQLGCFHFRAKLALAVTYSRGDSSHPILIRIPRDAHNLISWCACEFHSQVLFNHFTSLASQAALLFYPFQVKLHCGNGKVSRPKECSPLPLGNLKEFGGNMPPPAPHKSPISWTFVPLACGLCHILCWCGCCFSSWAGHLNALKFPVQWFGLCYERSAMGRDHSTWGPAALLLMSGAPNPFLPAPVCFLLILFLSRAGGKVSEWLTLCFN